MTAWPTVPISSVSTIVSGGTPKSDETKYWDGNIPWATPRDLSNIEGPFIDKTPRTISEKGLDHSSANILPANSVLFSSRAPIGHVAINTVPMATNQGFKSFVPNPDQLDSKFLYHWLIANRAHLESLGNGATFKEVSKAVVARVEIPLPPLPEQRRIAAILDHADALRTKRRQSLSYLDELVQSTFVQFQSRSDSTATPFTDAYWFQEGPGIRKWQFFSKGVKVLNVGNIIKDGSIDLDRTDRHITEDEAFGRYKHFLVDAGDLVIASSGVPFDTDGLLRTRGSFVREEHLPLCMNTSTIRFKAIEMKSRLEFLQSWMNSFEFRSQITKLVTGTAQQNFGPSHLRKLFITLPPYAAQAEFSEKISWINKSKQDAQISLSLLDSEFTSLQRNAFSGAL